MDVKFIFIITIIYTVVFVVFVVFVVMETLYIEFKLIRKSNE